MLLLSTILLVSMVSVASAQNDFILGNTTGVMVDFVENEYVGNNSTDNATDYEWIIQGWWSESTPVDFCTGTYYPTSEPIEFDYSGNTCYINPYLKDPDTQENAIVMWMGPYYGGQTPTKELYLYHLLLPPKEVAVYFPKDCTSNGVCSCESIESLRSRWNTTVPSIEPNDSFRSIFDITKTPVDFKPTYIFCGDCSANRRFDIHSQVPSDSEGIENISWSFSVFQGEVHAGHIEPPTPCPTFSGAASSSTRFGLAIFLTYTIFLQYCW